MGFGVGAAGIYWGARAFGRLDRRPAATDPSAVAFQGGMPRDELNEAVVLLDSAIKHANQGLPRSSAGWNPEQRQQATDAMERAIGLMQLAAEDLMSTHPGAKWGTFDGDLERPYLDRAIGLMFEARGIVGQEQLEGAQDREALQRASKAIDEAFELMGGVATID